MQAHAVLAHRFQNRERADDVGVQERLGCREGVVDVRLRGEVCDGVGLGDELGHQFGLGDVAFDQPNVVLHRGQ